MRDLQLVLRKSIETHDIARDERDRKYLFGAGRDNSRTKRIVYRREGADVAPPTLRVAMRRRQRRKGRRTRTHTRARARGEGRDGYWRECNAPYSLSYDTAKLKLWRLKLNRGTARAAATAAAAAPGPRVFSRLSNGSQQRQPPAAARNQSTCFK